MQLTYHCNRQRLLLFRACPTEPRPNTSAVFMAVSILSLGQEEADGRTAVPPPPASVRGPGVWGPGPGPGGYIQDVPLEGPKKKMFEKLCFDGFGPSQMTCPKNGQKMIKKWSKNGPGKIWDHFLTIFAWVFDK